METLAAEDELRARIAAWRRDGERIAFVPTMGNLHAGHLALVEFARRRGTRVVVSIFVNPMQFAAGEDFDSYPRTPAEDSAALRAAQADLLFAPEVATIYPRGPADQTRVTVPDLGDALCGRHRPGHFSGVATVVAKLFNLVQPDIAVFGEKDYQQLLVIRRMCRDLCFPVEIQGVPTVREADGLAMSSRNRYLDPAQRRTAALLYRTLQEVVVQVREGAQPLDGIETAARARLEGYGFRPDYVEVRRAGDLGRPAAGDERRVVLAAAWLGEARLIDNIAFQMESDD